MVSLANGNEIRIRCCFLDRTIFLLQPERATATIGLGSIIITNSCLDRIPAKVEFRLKLIRSLFNIYSLALI